MDPSVYITEEELQHLAAITEFAEFLEDPTMSDDEVGAAAASPKDVEYFLVDDSPMAKFSRSIKWAYKKVSPEWPLIRGDSSPLLFKEKIFILFNVLL